MAIKNMTTRHRSATSVAMIGRVRAFVLCGGLVLAAAAVSARPVGVPPPHTLTIHSTEQLQLAPKDEKQWYERGPWPLMGAAIALIITNAVSVGVVYFSSVRSFKALLRQRKIELLAASLNEFYNPLLALLDINKEIFDKTGPPSWPLDEISRDAAARAWRVTKKKILVNNAQIELILKTKTHLLYGTDSLDAYHQLLIHVAMYETFQAVETDVYQGFLFPTDVRTHVAGNRNAVLNAFYEATGEQI